MKADLEKLIRVAKLPNNSLKTVIKARNTLKTELLTAIATINQLIAVNEKIEKTPNKFDAEMCNESGELYDNLHRSDVYKYSSMLTDLLDHPDQELVHNADDLIDLIDETGELIIAKRNPLKGKEYSPIPQ